MPLEIANPLGGRALSLRAMLERQRVQVLRCADGGTLTVTGTVPRSITRRRVEILGTSSMLALSLALRRATAAIAGAASAVAASLIQRRASVEAAGQAETVARSQALRRASAVIAGGATVTVISPVPTVSYAVELVAEAAAMFADTALTTAASIDGSVAGYADATANGNDALQATAGARPTRRNSGSLDWLDFDGIDDRLVIAADASWRGASMSLIMVARFQSATSGGSRVIAGTTPATGGNYVVLYQDGSTSTSVSTAGASAFYADGVQITGTVTRQSLYDAWVKDDWVILEVAGWNASGTSFATGLQFPGWREANNLADCDIGDVLILPTADANTHRATIVADLAAKWGITL